MKTPVLLTLVLIIASCGKEEVAKELDIYHEWRWEMTTFGSRGRPLTSASQDTTYYYNFQRNGVLQVKDDDRLIQSEFEFRLVEGQPFDRILIESENIEWGYSIANDTLRIWKPNAISAATVIFKAEHK